MWNYKNLIKSFSDNASNNCSYTAIKTNKDLDYFIKSSNKEK